jgi:hypothetical protein
MISVRSHCGEFSAGHYQTLKHRKNLECGGCVMCFALICSFGCQLQIQLKIPLPTVGKVHYKLVTLNFLNFYNMCVNSIVMCCCCYLTITNFSICTHTLHFNLILTSSLSYFTPLFWQLYALHIAVVCFMVGNVCNGGSVEFPIHRQTHSCCGISRIVLLGSSVYI